MSLVQIFKNAKKAVLSKMCSSSQNIPKNDDPVVSEILALNLLKLKSGHTVKLIGVNPPKVTHEDCIPFLEQLLLGKDVRLDVDKLRDDDEGNLLAYVYINAGKEFCLLKETEITKKYKNNLSYVEFNTENPKNLIEKDIFGNESINTEVASSMKPKNDLFLQVNLALISCGFADFKSMSPNTSFDSLFEAKYKEAFENKLGIWGNT